MTHSEYERQSNIAAGLCADCMKPLKPDEVHCCQQCADSFLEFDPNGKLHNENTEEAKL